ncbi:MAG: HNH endonuclease [Lachnospiraceae bacterium]
MNIFGGFKESSDVNDIDNNNKLEINQDAQDKFEQIMGDVNLPETVSHADKEVLQEKSSAALLNKFEGLFKMDFDPTTVLDEKNQSFLSETSAIDRDGGEAFADNIGESKVDNYRLPRNGGEWSGEPGNSEWKPDSETVPGDRNGTNPEDKSWKEIKDQYDFDGISFEDGRPDFSEVSKGEVEIEDFSDNRRKNFVQADEKLAEQKGCQPSEVRQWRTENKYTWHEEADCKTMLKVPSEVHGNIPHDGGISEMKSQKDEQE